MFAKNQTATKLDKEILAALDELATHKKTSEEYGVVVDRITKLHKLKSEEEPKLPSMEHVMTIGANIFGIIWLTRYERDRVLSSKALGFVMRPR